MQLAETQGAFRGVIVAGTPPTSVLEELADIGDKAYRLSIHQRHFEASLVTALRTRYPTLEWLLGSEFLTAAATLFAHAHPPAKPCIAEYGADFPAFVQELGGMERMPWLANLGAVEWHVGRVSVAIAKPALTLDGLAPFAEVEPDNLAVTLQPGLAYLKAEWPVDALIALRLSGNAPEQLHFEPKRVALEVRGARGDFSIRQLDRGDFAFRAGLLSGAPLGSALESAIGVAAEFDPSVALAKLFAENLVTALSPLNEDR